MEWWAFLKGFLRSPGAVGAVIPTGKAASQALARAAGVGQATRVLEIGAGTGPVTEAILAELDGDLISVERDVRMAAVTRSKFRGQCEVVTGDALDSRRFLEERGMSSVDSVVCANPFTTMSKELQFEMLDMIDDVLDEDGGFSAIMYMNGALLPSFWSFIRTLKDWFPDVSLGVVWRNAPPAFIVRVRKVRSQ